MRRLLYLVAALGVASGVALSAAHAPRTVRITAKKFDFEPAQIHLKKGETVVLELATLDRAHGFKLPALGIRADVDPGETVRITVTPDKTGAFAFLCDVFCGDGHDDMEGQIVVEE